MSITQSNLYKKLFGEIGEKRAASYLKKKGFEIIEKNYRSKFGEMDLIGLYGDFLVFIEVKSRTSEKFGSPCEAVDLSKQAKYRRGAEFFIMTHPELENYQPRFDVVEVFKDEINHLEDAFQ